MQELSRVSSVNSSRIKSDYLGRLIREAVKVDVIHSIPGPAMIDKLKEPGMSVPVDVSDLPIILPPDDLSEVGFLDLKSVIEQMKDPVTSPKLAEIYDKSPLKLFKTFIESKGRSYNESYYKNIVSDLKPLILELKLIYNRPRPLQLAHIHGMRLIPLHTKTASSPAYPSGHTIQSFVVAILLAYQFPDLADRLLKIAELIAQSRVDAGLHFQSDIIFGRMLAALIAREILNENFA